MTELSCEITWLIHFHVRRPASQHQPPTKRRIREQGKEWDRDSVGKMKSECVQIAEFTFESGSVSRALRVKIHDHPTLFIAVGYFHRAMCCAHHLGKCIGIYLLITCIMYTAKPIYLSQMQRTDWIGVCIVSVDGPNELKVRQRAPNEHNPNQ